MWNPNKGDEIALCSPKEILAEMKELDTKIQSSVLSIKNII